MARIKTYVNDENISEYDTVIGSDAESLNGTKNYSMASILKFLKSGFNPETGGDLNIRELSYTGSIYTTPHGYLNSLDPYITILQYDVVIVNINNTKYLLKKQDTTVGFEQVPLLSSDFILIKEPQINSDWNSTSGVSQILNKPTIPVPVSQVNSDWNSTSGVSQVLNKPAIPSAQVNSDWNSTTGVSQILNKPTVDGSETKINPGTNTTVTGIGTVVSPYVISSTIAWLPGDTKEVVCNSTYLANNFETSGLGKNERLGWAIMNGATHGSVTVPNDNGRVVISYGTSYTTLETTGGSENAVLIGHDHSFFQTAGGQDGGGNVTTGNNPIEGASDLNMNNTGVDQSGLSSPNETGTGKNMQPYVVRLRIMKL